MGGTLYEQLEVGRDADETAIRRGFRKAAKQAHPDGGGSEEAFTALSRALAVLTDPRARAYYDKTGKVEEPEPDNEMSAILVICAQALLSAIEQGNVEYDSVIANAKRIISDTIGKGNNEKHAIIAAIKKMETVRRRLKRTKKEGPNLLDDILNGQIGDANRRLATLEETLNRLKKAAAIVGEYTYEVEARQPSPTAHSFFNDPGLSSIWK